MKRDLDQKMALVVRAVVAGSYRYTIHGAQQRIARRIQRQELEEAVAAGEIIEDYPEHHHGPACLILGWTSAGRALHIVCSVRPVVDIITVYDPDPGEWSADYRTRIRE
jgi:hypothetical protein